MEIAPRIHSLVHPAAQLIQTAYECFEPRIGRIATTQAIHAVRRLGWNLLSLQEWRNVQVMVVASRDRTASGHRLVAGIIPGTNQGSDWSANFNPLPMRIGGLPGRWRRGFALGGEWAWKVLEDQLQPGDRILIAGHSYGAAMTLVAAAYAKRENWAGSVLGVLAFASPRTTTRRGADFLQSAYCGTGQRYILGFDVVPWSVFPVGWSHALSPIFIGTDGSVSARLHFWRELWNAIRRRGFQAVSDHKMLRYLEWAARVSATEAHGSPICSS